MLDTASMCSANAVLLCPYFTGNQQLQKLFHFSDLQSRCSCHICHLPEQWHPHIHLHIPWNYCLLPRQSVTDFAHSQNIFGSHTGAMKRLSWSVLVHRHMLAGTAQNYNIFLLFFFYQQIYLYLSKNRNCLVNLLTFPDHSTLKSAFRGYLRLPFTTESFHPSQQSVFYVG